MLEFIYCEEILFDLPPPTLFCRGDLIGFEQLKKVIENMIIEQNEICLNNCDFVIITETTKKIIFRPFSNQILLKITDTEIITDISIKDWGIILDYLKEILSSKNSLTYFFEFENYIEEGNFVLES